MGADAEVAIEVTLNETTLEKKLRKLESKLSKQKLDLEITFGNQEYLESQLAKVLKQLDKIEAKKKKLASDKTDITTQLAPIQEKINNKQSIGYEENILYEKLMPQLQAINKEEAKLTKEASKYNSEVEKLNQQLDKAEIKYQQQSEAIQQTEQDIVATKNAITQEQAEANKMDFSNVKKDIESIKNGSEKIIKKVARWGLAIFSVRSAYNLVRQAMSSLAQSNKQIGADVEYIRFALASALQPIIEKIIELAYKLLAYIGYIAKAWFGVNIFANATAKAFQKANKGVKDTNKSAKQLQKTLAGFDEMNILNDETNKGGGGGVSVGTPSVDLSKSLPEGEIPGWVEWLAEHGETVKNVLIGIGTAIGLIKILKLADDLGILGQTISVIGLIGLIHGVYNGIKDLKEVIDNPDSLGNWKDLMFDLGEATLGFSGILLGLNASNPFGWVTLGLGLVLGLAGALIDTTGDIKTMEQANKDLKEAQEAVNKAYNEYISAGKSQVSAMENARKAHKDLQETAKKLGITEEELNTIGGEWFELIADGKMDVNDLDGEELELYKAYLNNVDAQSRLKDATEKLQKAEGNLTEEGKKEIAQQLERQRTISDTTGKWEDYRDAVIDAFKKGAITSEDASKRIGEAFGKTENSAKLAFVEGVPKNLTSGIETVKKWSGNMEVQLGKLDGYYADAETDTQDFTKVLKKEFETNAPKSVQKTTDKVVKLRDEIDKLRKNGNVTVTMTTKTSSSGGSKNAKGAIYYPPRLAVGGIINQPGRGVPLAMGGERGAEGVIPLTDAQQMQRLGEAIGKYITVNATMVNQMNGRIISRELKQMQNEENFAFNR